MRCLAACSSIALSLCAVSQSCYAADEPSVSAAKLEGGAAKGDRDAQFALSFLYEYGNGVPQDKRKAARWLLKAAENGLPVAQLLWGDKLARGDGVQQNRVEAAKWYRAAAEQGDATAQHLMGQMYLAGITVQKDANIAIQWFQKSADQGNSRARYSLAREYEKGENVDKDYVSAFSLMSASAKQGFRRAQIGLAFDFALGQGTPRDAVLAYMWANLAASTTGDVDDDGEEVERIANDLRSAIGKKMTVNQIAKAEELASRCYSSNYNSCGY